MKELDAKGRQIFCRYLATYLALLVTVSIPFYALTRRTLHMLKENTVKDSYATLNNGFENINDDIVRLYEAAITLNAESNFTQLLRIKGKTDTRDSYKLLAVRKYLSNMYSTSDMSVGCGLIFEEAPFVITTESVYHKLDYFYPNVISVDTMTFPEWKESLFSESGLINLYAAKRMKLNKTEEREILQCTIPMPATVMSPKKAMLYFLFDSSILAKTLLSEDIIKDSFVILTNKNDEIILSFRYEGELGDLPCYGATGITERRIDGVNTTLMSMKNRDTGMTVVVGIPDRLFNQKIAPYVWLLLIYIISAILLGLVVSFYLAHRQAVPLQSIVNTAATITGTSNYKNEFRYIQDVLLSMNQDNESYRKRLALMDDSIRISLTQKVLSEGALSQEEKTEFMRYYGLADTFYCVILADVLYAGTRVGGESATRDINLLVGELMHRQLSCDQAICHIESGRSVIIVNLPGEEEGALARIEEVLSSVAREIREKTMSRVIFRVSAIAAGVENIHLCFWQAKNTLILSEEQPETQVFSYSRHMYNRAPVLFDTDMAKKLHDLLVIGESGRTADLFAVMIRSSEKDPMDSDMYNRQIFYSIRNVLESAVHEVLRRGDEFELPVLFDHDFRTMPVRQVLTFLKVVADRLCTYVQSLKRIKDQRLKHSVLEFIQDNYPDNDLCIAMAAEKLGLSEKYILSAIREQTGKSFAEYVESVRMKQAEQMLLHTDDKINQIYGKIGFYSQNTFYKAFYRIYGVSPGVWRDHNRMGES